MTMDTSKVSQATKQPRVDLLLCISVMRSLGIPARSVTNFASAHDTEENLKVDIYVNENGQKLDRLTNDSIW